MLLKLKGKPLIAHVYLNARKSSLIKALYVATDSPKIRKAVEAVGGKVIMTPASCRSGSERIKEALKRLKACGNDIIVNIQGDEPLLEPRLIDRTVKALMTDKDCEAATLASPIREKKEIEEPSVVKVVIGVDNRALYFSRAAIPFDRDGNKRGAVLKHIGLYAYRKGVLDRWQRLESRYEQVEKLEQLRLIENGIGIKVVVAKSRSIGVDTKKDAARVRKLMQPVSYQLSSFANKIKEV